MEKLNDVQTLIFLKICTYVHELKGGDVSRWDCVNFLIGYYGQIGSDHIAAIQAAVREGLVEV